MKSKMLTLLMKNFEIINSFIVYKWILKTLVNLVSFSKLFYLTNLALSIKI